jgi:hypothetical protein
VRRRPERLPRVALASLVAIASIAACAAMPASEARADPLSMIDLRVEGGSAWQPINDFRVDWDREPFPPKQSAVDYLLRDETGSAVGPTVRSTQELEAIERLHAPAPGLYTVEAWLEGPYGEEGPHSEARFRFDDVSPAPARPEAPTRWIPAGVPAVLRIQHPDSPQPLSGIRGYAVSLDRGVPSSPCALPTRCSGAEIDLSGGIDDDTISLGILPEGVNVARVVAVSGSGVPSSAVESAEIRVDATPPETTLSGLAAGWARRPVRLTATAGDRLSGMAAAGPAGPFTAIAVDGNRPSLAPGNSVSTLVGGDGVHCVAFYARDAAGNIADGLSGASNPPSAVVRIDETPPVVAFATARDRNDPERIVATVSDRLSGPNPSRGSIGIRPRGSRLPFATIPTGVHAGVLVARWDSDAYPPGTYEFAASGYDGAGNSAVSFLRADGARMILANPVKTPVELKSSFVGRPARRVVPYGRGTRFGGRATTISGSPLAGIEIAVVESFAAGSLPDRRMTVVRTGRDGTFATRLAPGPSRQVVATFAGSRTLTRASGGTADLGVLAGARLRASASTARVGGAPVLFGGRVANLGAPLPSSGIAVQLQFRYPGSGWSEFRTVSTDRHGRFRYAYAFSDDDSRGVRFQFRAFVPAQERWPYEPSASRPVTVTGR